LDLLEQRHLRLDGVEILVLDEADRMLDMGFVRDVRRVIAATPKKRQSLCFSATMPREVEQLVDKIFADALRIEATPADTTLEPSDQRVYHVNEGAKQMLLGEVLKEQARARGIVFTRTKRGANRVAEHLARTGVAAEAIHGNKSQSARLKALDNFRGGRS